jgi:hypothetical protein
MPYKGFWAAASILSLPTHLLFDLLLCLMPPASLFPLPLVPRFAMAPKRSRSKKGIAEGSRSRDPFLPFEAHGGGQGLEQLAGYVADGSNKRGSTILAHASEAVGREARHARFFLCFLVAGMVPPMLLFLHTMLSTYGVVLAHLHPNALLTLAIFQYLCEAFVGVRPLVALFHIFFEARLDTGGAISGCLSFHLRPSKVTCFIPMPNREWVEWRANWCFMRFDEEDDHVASAKPMGFPEALSVWTSLASMVGLEAPMERIQNLHDNHLAAHHVVNSVVHHDITPLQWLSCPHWEVLSQNHPTRLHQEGPSEDEILRVSNFLTGSNQT